MLDSLDKSKNLVRLRIILLTVAVLVIFISCADSITVQGQTIIPAPPRPAVSPTPFAAQQLPIAPARSSSSAQATSFAPPNNYLKNSAAFRQEIARMEISVVRGEQVLPITQVPRVQKDDVIKVRLLDEAVGGIKPDQSMWDWTFLVAFVNPNRNQDKEESLSEEIQFRKSGWYKEYSFTVPYDSQPVFFLYPKPKYREKILKLIGKNFEEVRKLGEKTIELAGAYAQINSFLNELQGVLHQTQYSRYATNNPYGSGYGAYNPYNTYNQGGNNPQPGIPFNYNAFMEQTIERLARSFNINMPQCWQSGSTSYGSYGGYGASGNQNSFGYAINADLISRAQCVAKNVRLEDFDFSISQLLKQGGIMLVTQLRDKYPQIAYWISIAAAALDFIVKVFQKSPLRIVPTIVQSSDNQQMAAAGSYQPYQTNYSPNQTYPPGSPSGINAARQHNPVKISLYAEAQPSQQSFVTAYPIVVQKWQSDPDPEVISLYPPVLSEPCLHVGVNILKSTSISDNPEADTFTKDFKLIMISPNGFRREFPLKKNPGAGGWELNLTKEDINSFPKINMTLESIVTGRRGFNELKSPPFNLPLSIGGTFEITTESKEKFSAGGKRIVTIRNPLGGCQCIQAVIYKPSFGGQFVFEANAKDKNNQLRFSPDGREVSFEVDATYFQPGAGQLELRTFGGEVSNLNLKLYPLPPDITDVKISKGDRQAIISGERLEQLQSVKINGKNARAQNDSGSMINNNPNQKVFVFDEAGVRQTAGTVSLELGLEDNRMFTYPRTFTAGAARPVIAANEENEIEGVFIDNAGNGISKQSKSQIDLSKYPVVSIDASELSVVVQNKLTDYEFKGENLSIETRIEKSQSGAAEAPKAAFEVLDTNALRINFSFSEQSQKFIGGRRLQFRIRDKERGDSDWYTIKQTFVRLPVIESVKCTPEMNGQCQLTGIGIDYISQVSVDGGKTWFPENNPFFQTQPAGDGKSQAMIPLLVNKNLFQIKLRDFPKTDGLQVKDFSFSNSVKTGSVREMLPTTKESKKPINK